MKAQTGGFNLESLLEELHVGALHSFLPHSNWRRSDKTAFLSRDQRWLQRSVFMVSHFQVLFGVASDGLGELLRQRSAEGSAKHRQAQNLGPPGLSRGAASSSTDMPRLKESE